ncbi:MAG: hypothetical protein OK436_03845 [Thaumarchaeota archaeon]|nr:hypothetical protein [Nitrososphaerota archaeon]
MKWQMAILLVAAAAVLFASMTPIPVSTFEMKDCLNFCPMYYSFTANYLGFGGAYEHGNYGILQAQGGGYASYHWLFRI